MPETTASTRALLDLLFDDDLVGHCLVAPDGRVLRANAEWLRSTGFELDRVLGVDIVELFPESRETALALYARARAGHRVAIPRHARDVGGVRTWWEGSIAPVPMEGGTGLLVTARKVTGAAPSGPETATALADYLSDVGPGGIVLYEPTPPFRILASNKAYQDMWPEPLRSRGLVGLGLAEYVSGAEEEGIAEIFRTAARTGVTQSIEEFAYEGLPGGTRWFNWTVAPVLRDGQTVALAHMAVEITREVRARKEAERAEAESRHAAELLELGDPFCELDGDFRIIRVNAAHERINRHSREQILGRTHWEVWPDSAAPSSPYWREYHRCMAERVRVEFDAYYAPLDVWTSVIAYPTAEGGIAIFWRDATQRKRAELALSAAESRQAYLVRLEDELRPLADAVAIQAAACRLIAEHLGVDRAYYVELDEHAGLARVGQDYARGGVSSLTGDHRVSHFGWIIPPLRLGETMVVADVASEARIPGAERAAMAEAQIAAHVSAPVTKAGSLVGAFCVTESRPRAWSPAEIELVEETAERVWSAIVRAQSEAALRDADRRKDEFLAVLSHELRNPLAPIRNSIHVIERAPPESPPARRARTVIRRQTEHLARLVDELLDVTRISRGKIELHRERLDAREIVRKVTEDLHGVFEHAGIALRVEQTDSTPVWVDADGTRLAQVVGNLLQNALKFTPGGGTVTLSLARAGAAAELRVRDSGLGIDPAELERMFEPFVQAERSLARTQGGLGLGLALVKGLVEAHGGTVEGRSEGVGRGAEFVVRLPLAEADTAGPLLDETR